VKATVKVSYTMSRQVAIEAPFGGTVHHPTAAATFFSDRASAPSRPGIIRR